MFCCVEQVKKGGRPPLFGVPRADEAGFRSEGEAYFRRNEAQLLDGRIVERENQWMESEPDSDAALMLKVQEGDFNAFETLVDKYKQPVTNIVARIIRDATEAEDIAQNVFLQMYKASGRYRVTAKFSTWLFTIARNLSLNEIRRRSRHPASSLEATFSGDDEDQPLRQVEDRQMPTSADQALRSELSEKIDAVLGELPVNQRTAIILVKEKGMSYDDIAGILGCSVSAVKSLIHRGRETIKSKIKPYLVSGTWDQPV